MSEQKIQPHIIIAEKGPDRYARGWHCLGLASDYTDQPTMLEYFGSKQVAFRGEDGDVHILDAYCAHMGADLSAGCVEGNAIRCPFHFWRWGPDGICDDIPYAKRIPKKAVIKSWPTMEENKLLFVWNDAEGNAPIPEQRMPRIDDVFSDDWSDWFFHDITVNSHPRELMDNMADVAHFAYVHSRGNGGASEFSNDAEGHCYTQHMASNRMPGVRSYSRATYQGPAVMETHMYVHPTDQPDNWSQQQRLLVAHTPIDQNSFHLRFGVLIKKDPGMGEGLTRMWLESQAEMAHKGFNQDVEIWKRKTQIDNPVLCDGDGPVTMLRKWFSYFYVDVNQIPNDYNKKRSHAVDIYTP